MNNNEIKHNKKNQLSIRLLDFLSKCLIKSGFYTFAKMPPTPTPKKNKTSKNNY